MLTFPLDSRAETIQTLGQKIVIYKLARKKRGWLFMRKKWGKRSRQERLRKNENISIRIFRLLTKARISSGWLAVTQSRANRHKQEALVMGIMHAWFDHVVQCMRSIKRNDAEPSRERTQPAWGLWRERFFLFIRESAGGRVDCCYIAWNCSENSLNSFVNFEALNSQFWMKRKAFFAE